MQPTNKQERKKAYINFMLLFLLCTAIIITTVFFSTRVPLKQNEELVQYKNAVYESNKRKTDFTEKMVVVSLMIDSADQKKSTNIETDVKIKKGIDDLDEMFKDDNNDENKLYQNIVKNLRYYFQAKVAVRDKADNNTDVKELNKRIVDLEKDSKDNYTKYMECLTRPK